MCHRKVSFQHPGCHALKVSLRRGDTSGSSDAEQIRAVIDLGNSKDPAICDNLTDKWMENVVGGDKSDCEQQVEQSSEDAVKIQDVSVDGDRSTVTARIEGDPGKLLLVKQDGEWKLDDIQTK